MSKLACVACVLGLLVASAVATRPVGAQGEDTPTIKDVMQKLHKGANSPLAKLKTELKAEQPDWPTIQDRTKDFVILGASLAKNEPPKGEAAAYKKLAEAYYEDAKALDDAAKEQDKAGATSAFSELSSSCMECHKAHRPS